MGLLQNVATLANPSANIIRPSDVLMAGQQAQQQIQAGISGLGNIMKEERKTSSQQRADEAVAGLLQNAPTGTQDPTKFNQMLGMASAYGSQGMKDTAKNAIESAREGYRTALQQQQFDKTFGLDTQKFEEAKRSAETQEGLKGQEIANAWSMGIAQIEANKENALLNAKTQKQVAQIHASAQAATNKLQRDIFGWTKSKDMANLESQGYTFGKDGQISYNPNNPKALLAYGSTLLGNFNKEYGASGIAKTAMSIGDINSGWNPFTLGGGSLFASQKGQAQDAVSRAAQVGQLLPAMIQDAASQKGATQRDIDALLGFAESFIRTGQGDTNNPFVKKYKLGK